MRSALGIALVMVNLAARAGAAAIPDPSPTLAGPDEFFRQSGSGLTIPVASLLANDLIDGATPADLAGIESFATLGGRVVRQGNWIQYRPPCGDPDIDQFFYTITNRAGVAAEGRVTVRVDCGALAGPWLAPPAVEPDRVMVRGTGTPGRWHSVQHQPFSEPARWYSAANSLVDTNGSLTAVIPPLPGTTSGLFRLGPPWWGCLGNLDPGAVADALAYARQQARAGAGAPALQRLVPRVATVLHEIYRTVGSNTLVDAGFHGAEPAVPGPHPAASLRGSPGSGHNLAATSSGLIFNGIDSSLAHAIPAGLSNVTLVTVIAGDTNATASDYQWVYSLCHSNTHESGALLMLGAHGNYYTPWTHNGRELYRSEPLYSRYFAAGGRTTGVSEGAVRSQAQFRTVAVSITGDGSRVIESHVDGLPAQRAAGGPIPPPGSGTRLQFGRMTGGDNPWRGRLQSWLLFNRALTTGEVQAVDATLRIAAQTVDLVIQGDSISTFDYLRPGIEWPQQLWHALGDPGQVVVHNHAYSGRRAYDLHRETSGILPPRRAADNAPRPHYFLLAGANDTLFGVPHEITISHLQEMWSLARAEGYVVHALTVLPMGTNAPGYTPAMDDEIRSLNRLMREFARQPAPPFDFLWDIAPLVTDPDDPAQLYDGLHPTPAVKASIGQLMATRLAPWLRCR